MTEILLHLSAGQGPRECEWVVARLVEAFAREGAGEGLACAPVEPIEGPVASAIVRVSGVGAERFVAARCGTIRWVGTSPFRPLHKRRNWFAGASRLPDPDTIDALRMQDVRFETLRASGPGGQHVNKTESAVRATHLPTGLTTVSQEQRSQHANRRIARLKLWLLLEARRHDSLAGEKLERWREHHALERGNAVRTYHGAGFKLVPPVS
jgi:peptide chain release factor